MLLDSTGYVKAQDGSNGFSRFVDRQTPLNQEPTCFDAEGSATTLPTRLFAGGTTRKGQDRRPDQGRYRRGLQDGRSFWRPGRRGSSTCSPDSIYLFIPQSNQLRARPSTLDVLCAVRDREGSRIAAPGMNMPRLIRAGQPTRS